MKGFKTNIEKDTIENNNFRKALYTSKHLQLVLMSLKVGEDIGAEIHFDNDQFFRFESGNGKCIIDGNVYHVSEGDAIIVPAGAKHNIINVDEKYIKTHEELAEKFAILCYVMGGISIVGLWLNYYKKPFAKMVCYLTIFVCAITLYYGKYTATTGGEIRHIEIR